MAGAQKHCPGKTEVQCREIIKQWFEAGVLVETEYEDPKRHEKKNGLYVDAGKRPQSTTAE